nr:putative RNA-dependent RNA polymerase [Rhizoctonia solani mitovirus 126]
MKNLFSQISASRFFSTIFDLGSTVHLDSVRRSLADSRTLLAMTQHIGFVMIHMCFTGKLKFTTRYRQLASFVGYLYSLRRRHGSKYVVMYLKSGLQALEKAVALTPVSSLQEFNTGFMLPRVSRSGLPAFIPDRDRKLILANHSEAVTRWWFTLFALFRVISIPGELKLSTITNPLSVTKESVLGVAHRLHCVIDSTMFRVETLLKEPEFQFLESASAVSKVSWLGYTYDAVLLKQAGLGPAVTAFCSFMGYTSWLTRFEYINQAIEGFNKTNKDVWENPIVGNSLIHSNNERLIDSENFNPATSNLSKDELESTKGIIGKLSIKEEPAGKRRVFAMVDSWTQSLLTPLHRMCETFLKSLPNDGLFDQYASVRRAQQKAAITGLSFGFDLSAATDRVPLILQIEVLNTLALGLGDLWANLLDRPFSLKERTIKKVGRRSFKKIDSTHIVKYTVGQPMGVRSSFPMLSVVHHLIVQLSARTAYPLMEGRFWLPVKEFISASPNSGLSRSGTSWYTGYELNGDDLVIFDQAVADQYLSVMRDIGCEINLTKSIIAKNRTFEFLKVVGHNGWDISPLPWKALLSQPTLMGRVTLVDSLLRRDIVRKGHKLSFIKNAVAKTIFQTGKEFGTAIIALATMQAQRGNLDILSVYLQILGKNPSKKRVIDALTTNSVAQSLLVKVVESYNKDAPVVIPPIKEHQPDPWNPWRETQAQSNTQFVLLTLRQRLDHALGYNPIVHGMTPELSVPGAPAPQRVLLPIRDAKAVAERFFAMPGLFIHPEIGPIGLGKIPNARLANPGTGEVSWTQEERNMWQLEYISFFKLILSKLSALKAEAEMARASATTLGPLQEACAILDRYEELCLIVDRANESLGGRPPRSLETDSPLAMLVSISKAADENSLFLKQRQKLMMPNVILE